MWEIYQDWESISSAPLGESMAFLLEFADEPMLLQRHNEDLSTDLEQESIARIQDIGNQSLESEQDLKA